MDTYEIVQLLEKYGAEQTDIWNRAVPVFTKYLELVKANRPHTSFTDDFETQAADEVLDLLRERNESDDRLIQAVKARIDARKDRVENKLKGQADELVNKLIADLGVSEGQADRIKGLASKFDAKSFELVLEAFRPKSRLN